MSGETLAKYPNLTTRNAVFYLRMRVPVDLVPVLKREHITLSLRTKDRREAIARYRVEQARLETQFRDLRDELSQCNKVRDGLATGQLQDLSCYDLEKLVADWFDKSVQRGASGGTEDVDWDDVLQEAQANVAVLTSPDPAQYQDYVDAIARRLLLDAGARVTSSAYHRVDLRARIPAVDKNSEQYLALQTLVRRALIALNKHRLSQLTGSANAEMDPIFVAGSSKRAQTRKQTLDQLIASFESDPGRGSRTEKTNADYGMVFRAMREVIGGQKVAADISREDCRRVRDLLISLPPNATKRFPNLTLSEAADVGSRKKLPCLNPQTINSHLTKMSTVFNWAAREEIIDKNPAARLVIVEGGKGRGKREPFSPDQLNRIFSAPLYTGCVNDEEGYAKTGECRIRRSRFWVPLLSLFHGLRLNEACQLRVADIAQRDGIPVLLIRAADASQRVKSRAGTRAVPVHPEIVAIGFLEFVEQMRLSGNDRVFPELKQDARGYYSDAFQKWFDRFLRSCAAKKPTTTFHCFRHGWADRLRDARVPQDRRRELGGWASTGVDDGYGKGSPIRLLAEDIASVSYPGLNLSHLYPPEPTI